jgi:hypothetical protein
MGLENSGVAVILDLTVFGVLKPLEGGFHCSHIHVKDKPQDAYFGLIQVTAWGYKIESLVDNDEKVFKISTSRTC